MGCIRLLLACAVVLGHLPIYWNVTEYYADCLHPYYPVQIFFVISGFYIAMVLNEKYLAQPRGIRTFYFNRYFRLAPAYWLIGIFTLILTIIYPRTFPLGVLIDGDYIRTTSLAYPEALPLKALLNNDYSVLLNLNILAKIIFLVFTNVTMFFQDLPAFFELFAAAGNCFLLIPQGWSLGMELLFYVMAPLLIKQKNLTLAIFCIASFALRYVFLSLDFPIWPWQQRFFGCEFMFFIFGIFAYRFYNAQELQQSPRRKRFGLQCLILLAAVIMAAQRFIPWINLNVLAQGHNPLHSLALGLFAMLCIPYIFSLSRYSRIDRWIGELSYPIYLWHICLGYIFVEYLTLWYGFFLVVISIVFSIPVVLMLEQPIEAFRNRRIIPVKASLS